MTAAAEAALIEAVSTGRDGDAVYFWARTDGNAGTSGEGSFVEPAVNFWTYCDSVNSGQCRYGSFHCSPRKCSHAKKMNRSGSYSKLITN